MQFIKRDGSELTVLVSEWHTHNLLPNLHPHPHACRLDWLSAIVQTHSCVNCIDYVRCFVWIDLEFVCRVNYCDQFVCLSVCVHILKTTRHNFAKKNCTCNSWLRQCDMLCTSGFVYDVMFTDIGANYANIYVLCVVVRPPFLADVSTTVSCLLYCDTSLASS